MSCYSEKLKTTLMARLPGAGEAAIELEMGNAAHEFFLETGAWRQTVFANLRVDIREYDMIPDVGTVGFISELEIDGSRYTPISGYSLAQRTWSGAYQVVTEFGHVSLNPAPSESKAKAVVANVSVVPEDCTCEIPEDIVNHYYEALLDTALGKLHSHVSKPYTNLQLATYYIGRYRAHITRARRIVAGGNVRATGPWVFPQIAPGKARRGGFYFGRGV